MKNFEKLEQKFEKIISAITLAGGRFIFVGGCVRDTLLKVPIKDVDAEVYGIPYEKIKQALSAVGAVSEVGKNFGVLKVKGYDIDISLPRFDTKVGPGHTGFSIKVDYTMSYAQAAKRRDLTINAIGYAPCRKELLDPYKGAEDLQKGVLQAVDTRTFVEDPLRGLRVAQFMARFCMTPTENLIDLCETLDISELPQERIASEMKKILFMGKKPSLGFDFLLETDLIDKACPEISVLDEESYSDLMVCLDDPNLQCQKKNPNYELYVISTLLAFIDPLNRSSILADLLVSDALKLKADHLLIQSDIYMVSELVPDSTLFWTGHYLHQASLSWHDLINFLKALHYDEEDLSRLSRRVMQTGALNVKNITPVVKGQDLIDRGYKPDKNFSEILEACLKVQFEQNLKDPGDILSQVL